MRTTWLWVVGLILGTFALAPEGASDACVGWDNDDRCAGGYVGGLFPGQGTCVGFHTYVDGYCEGVQL